MGQSFNEFAGGDPLKNITVEASHAGSPGLSDIVKAAEAEAGPKAPQP